MKFIYISPGANNHVHHAGSRLHQVHERTPAGAKVAKSQLHTTCSQLNYICNDCVLKGYRTRGKTDPDCRGRRHRDLQMGRAQPRGDTSALSVAPYQ